MEGRNQGRNEDTNGISSLEELTLPYTIMSKYCYLIYYNKTIFIDRNSCVILKDDIFKKPSWTGCIFMVQ